MTTEKPTGRAIGGKARMAKLTPDERKAISAKMVEAKKAKAGLPKATHEGKLLIGDLELDVAVLENKKRIITQSAVFKALDRPARGNSRVIGIPVFMDAKNLQAFIDEDLRYGSKKEKPAHGGLMVIFQLQLEEQIGYLEY